MSAYRLEWQHPDGRWASLVGGECSLNYGHGYIDALRSAPTPRLGYRLVRARDERIMAEIPAVESADIGMVAGWPSWQQYARAAHRALTLSCGAFVRSDGGDKHPRGRLAALAHDIEAMLAEGDA